MIDDYIEKDERRSAKLIYIGHLSQDTKVKERREYITPV